MSRTPVAWLTRKTFALAIVALASVVLLTSCSLDRLYSDREHDYDTLSSDRMTQIVDAVNRHDAAALKGMFTEYALAEYSAEIADGLEYLLGLFPNGDVIWQDPIGDVYPTKANDYGDKTTLLNSVYHVSSGGVEYRLFFTDFIENTIDPENLGVYTMGAVPWTASEDSGPEVAYFDWSIVINDVYAAGPPGVFVYENGELSGDRMLDIVDALNGHDAAALKSMFTEYARTEHSTDLDHGLNYLLGLFPDGDIVWEGEPGGSVIYERVDGDKKAVLLRSYYRVSSGGVEYRLLFAHFTENSIDPENVGVYAIGVVPIADRLNVVPEADLYQWARSIDVGATAHPGAFIPPREVGDARMEQIAAAVNNQDAAALKGMFSAYALERAPEIDKRLDYLLARFANGGMTWTQDKVDAYDHVESGKLTESLHGHYKVSVEGHEYRLFFSDFTLNEVVNPDNVGLYALGVGPWTESSDPEQYSGSAESFLRWVGSMTLDGHENDYPGENGYAGVYTALRRNHELGSRALS